MIIVELEMLKDELTISIIAGSAFFLMLTVFCVLFILYYLKHRIKEKKEREFLHFKFQQQLLQSKLEIQEQAFNEISRELHDNIGQQLSLAKLNLNTLKHVTDTKDQEKIDTAKDLIGDTIYQIRSISKTLLGEKVSSIGIADAIKNETERLEKAEVFSISFHSEPPAFAINPQKEIILFRIVQEALNNITKHAAATRVAINLSYEENILKILIQDNGKGFNLEGAETNGIGLLNMRTRAATIGATLQIFTAKQTGTLIEITLQNQ